MMLCRLLTCLILCSFISSRLAEQAKNGWQRHVSDFLGETEAKFCTLHYFGDSQYFKTLNDNPKTFWNVTYFSQLLKLPMLQIKLLIENVLMGVNTFQVQPNSNEIYLTKFLSKGQ